MNHTYGKLVTRLIMALMALVSHIALADPQVFVDADGVALKGYDPVAYFVDKQPTQGKKTISAKYNDATYYFASEEHRATFQADPAHYVAQYGGYCAYGASFGKKAPGDPTQWSVVNGKLYINYDARVQKKWTDARDSFISKADQQWDGIKND